MIKILKLAVHYVVAVPLILIGAFLMYIGWCVDKFMGYDFLERFQPTISEKQEDMTWELLSGREL